MYKRQAKARPIPPAALLSPRRLVAHTSPVEVNPRMPAAVRDELLQAYSLAMRVTPATPAHAADAHADSALLVPKPPSHPQPPRPLSGAHATSPHATVNFRADARTPR